MTESERRSVEMFAHALTSQIGRAREAINAMNFGIARAILDEPAPELVFASVDTAENEADTGSLVVFDAHTGKIISAEAEKPATGKKTGKKKDVAASSLEYPYTSEAFMTAWGRLMTSKKWQKKGVDKLQWNLNRMAKYPEEFCIVLMEEAYNNDWQGVVFESTPAKFERWLASSGGLVPISGTCMSAVPLPTPTARPSKVRENLSETQRALSLIDGMDR